MCILYRVRVHMAGYCKENSSRKKKEYSVILFKAYHNTLNP